ncbi:hypothetical protein GALMADRAFT_209836 [Galerina marginata CBS 339.88]|uniref:Uncharacterized protein n=1 Tax=Galerina marginata (strain CBS 339.88) TaxID=685588 RepID=A0A067T5A2_GALM3|nr:hypothetical protein GALMADRAFT_209836 [Galerina marginata CBS 339.88]
MLLDEVFRTLNSTTSLDCLDALSISKFLIARSSLHLETSKSVHSLQQKYYVNWKHRDLLMHWLLDRLLRERSGLSGNCDWGILIWYILRVVRAIPDRPQENIGNCYICVSITARFIAISHPPAPGRIYINPIPGSIFSCLVVVSQGVMDGATASRVWKKARRSGKKTALFFCAIIMLYGITPTVVVLRARIRASNTTGIAVTNDIESIPLLD